MTDLGALLSGPGMLLFFKVIILLALGLFVVFTIFLLNYIQSLKKIIIIQGLTGSVFIYMLAILYLIASASLFLFALVIL